MTLAPIEVLNGILSLIFVVISTYVGIKIALNYVTYKKGTFILVGITWIGLSSLWIAPSISIILALITDNGLTPFWYFFIANALIPIYMFTWMIVITDFLYKDNQKLILLLSAGIGVVVEFFFLFFLFTDISIIGELQGAIDTDWGLFMLIYYLSVVLIIIITGTLFARESLKSENPEIRLKGKFLMSAFYMWFIGSALDTISSINITLLILARVFLIISAILFYIGLLLPEYVKKYFLKP